jgi:hypothetical protein
MIATCMTRPRLTQGLVLAGAIARSCRYEGGEADCVLSKVDIVAVAVAVAVAVDISKTPPFFLLFLFSLNRNAIAGLLFNKEQVLVGM